MTERSSTSSSPRGGLLQAAQWLQQPICFMGARRQATRRGRMNYDDYLREEAAKYRKLAEEAADPLIKQELHELAATCEEVANHIEDRMTAG